MNITELQEYLKLHSLWLQNDETGKRANLYGANLYGANLYGANLYGANLSGANLYGANLSRANLYGANLYGADLYGANLSKTLLEGKSILSFQFQKHGAYFYGTDEIVIGCHRHTISHWLESLQAIGKSENYTPEQIEKYGEFIKYCASLYKVGAK